MTDCSVTDTFTITSKIRPLGGLYRLKNTSSGLEIFVVTTTGQSVYEKYSSPTITLCVPDVNEWTLLYNESVVPNGYPMQVEYLPDPPIYDEDPTDGYGTYAVLSIKYGEFLEHSICLVDPLMAGARVAQAELLSLHRNLFQLHREMAEILRRLPRHSGILDVTEIPKDQATGEPPSAARGRG